MEGYQRKNLLVASAYNKARVLQTKGVQISVEKFDDKGSLAELVIIGKEKKVFQFSTDDKFLYLENPEHKGVNGRPAYQLPEDMADYLLILANGGPILGLLMYPGTEEKRFTRVPEIIPT